MGDKLPEKSTKVKGDATTTVPVDVSTSGSSLPAAVDLDSIDMSVADKSPVNTAASSDGKYSVGSRLEAMDLSTSKWYSVKVVEVDWEEGEVLIHFEKWSQRFDEWIPVDSSRLRQTQQAIDGKAYKFQIGETVMAVWSKRKYPAKVKAILSGDLYEVLFYDGFSKTMKENKLSKCVPGQEILTMATPASVPAVVTMTKAERRERKRKIHSVAELFHTKKMPKKSKDSFSPPYVIPDFEEKPKRLKLGKEQKKKPRLDSATWSDEGEKAYINMDSSLTQEDSSVNESSTDLDKLKKVGGKVKPKRKKRQYQKISLEQSPATLAAAAKEVYPFKGRKYNDAISPDDYDNWEPDGDDAYIVETGEGLRRSIIVQDDKLPWGWSKHTIQRKSGNSAGKWDVFLVSPNGRRFRSRKEMLAYFIEMKEEYKPDLYDFTLRGLTKQQICNMKRKSLDTEHLKPVADKKSKQRAKPAAALGVAEAEKPRRGKAAPVSTAAEPVSVRPPLEGGKVYVGALEIQMENDAFNCPSDGCAKHFRKENLLQMHIKYYHPELNKYMGSTPNVADLAYARTVGEPFEDTSFNAAFFDKMKKVRQLAMSPPTFPGGATDEKKKVVKTNVPESSPKQVLEPPVSTSSPIVVSDHFIKPPVSTPLRDLLREQPKAGVTAGIKTLLPIVRTTTKIGPKDQAAQEPQKEAVNVDAKRRPRKRQLSGAYAEQWERKKQVKHPVQPPPEKAQDEVKPPNPFLTPASRLSFNKKKMPLLSASLSKPPVHVLREPTQSTVTVKPVTSPATRHSTEDQRNKVDIINCTCGIMEEDGLMIQCDLCLCWQHGLCHNIEQESQVPEKYVCAICLNPARERKSQKHVHNQDWLKEGVLPTLTSHQSDVKVRAARTLRLKKSHDLTASLLDIGRVVNSLRVKVNIANSADHPKLYLWAKPWDKETFDESVKKERVSVKIENSLTSAGGDNNLNILPSEIPTSNARSILQALTRPASAFNSTPSDVMPSVVLEPPKTSTDTPSNEDTPSTVDTPSNEDTPKQVDAVSNLDTPNTVGTASNTPNTADAVSNEDTLKQVDAVSNLDTLNTDTPSNDDTPKPVDTASNLDTLNPVDDASNVNTTKPADTPSASALDTADAAATDSAPLGSPNTPPTTSVQDSSNNSVKETLQSLDVTPLEPPKPSPDPPNLLDTPKPSPDPPNPTYDGSILANDPFIGTAKSSEMVLPPLTEMMNDLTNGNHLDESAHNQLLQFPICPSELIRFANSIADNLKAAVPVAAAPEPEKPIDAAECRLLLLEHIEQHQQQVKMKLDQLEEHIAALEAEDPEPAADETIEFFPQTKQTFKMLLRDLVTVCNVATIN